ncbi:MAG: hypothetical protein WC417_06110 [Candidatus Omnitrophota bacterium]|jgi:HEAT repeat protein
MKKIFILLVILFFSSFSIVYLRAETTNDIMQKVELLQNNDQKIRQQAVYALGEMGKSAVPTLVKVLEDIQAGSLHYTNRTFVIHGILVALGEFGDSSIVPVFFKFLDDEDDNLVRYTAEAICNMGSEKDMYNLLKVATKEIIFLDDLEKTSGVPAEKASEEVIKKAEPHEIKLVSIFTGMEIYDKKIIPFLIKTSNSQDWEVRYAAIIYLGNKLSYENREFKLGITEALKNRLNDENQEIREKAKSYLKKSE